MTSCLFCRIARCEVAAILVHEDETLMAFLDIQPIRPGHMLLITRAHYPTFDDMPADVAARMMRLGQRLTRALEQAYPVDRVAFLFTGGDFPHVHAHLVPMVEKTDITSRRYIAEESVTFRSLPTPPADEMAKTAERLRMALVEEAG